MAPRWVTEADRPDFSDALAMELATELTADILGLGECPLILATDGKDHPLTALDLVWRRDAEPVVRRSQRGQNLDGEVSLGRVVEEGDNPKLGLRALDGTGPNLRHFHGALYFFPKSRWCGLDGCICAQTHSIWTKFDALLAISQGGCAAHCPECERCGRESLKLIDRTIDGLFRRARSH